MRISRPPANPASAPRALANWLADGESPPRERLPIGPIPRGTTARPSEAAL
ncbi:hypothetical protein PQR02_27955 [Paraburkholderia sediminicola]|uniref:hypothetical protein n=1 Tax=Paraburkholderia sediminicola TaxID=458836 RepID=UPI0038BBCA97